MSGMFWIALELSIPKNRVKHYVIFNGLTVRRVYNGELSRALVPTFLARIQNIWRFMEDRRIFSCHGMKNASIFFCAH